MKFKWGEITIDANKTKIFESLLLLVITIKIIIIIGWNGVQSADLNDDDWISLSVFGSRCIYDATEIVQFIWVLNLRKWEKIKPSHPNWMAENKQTKKNARLIISPKSRKKNGQFVKIVIKMDVEIFRFVKLNDKHSWYGNLVVVVVFWSSFLPKQFFSRIKKFYLIFSITEKKNFSYLLMNFIFRHSSRWIYLVFCDKIMIWLSIETTAEHIFRLE